MRSKVEKENKEKGKGKGKKKKKKKRRGASGDDEAGKKPQTTKSSYASFLLQNRLFVSIHLYFIGPSLTAPLPLYGLLSLSLRSPLK